MKTAQDIITELKKLLHTHQYDTLAISAPRAKGCLMKSSKEHPPKKSLTFSVNSTPLKSPARLFG
jgi:hypothetical protein